MKVVVFFLIAAALLLAALAIVLPSLFGRGSRESTNRTAQNLAIARERLEELKLQRERGEISEPEYAQGREDIERGLADDLATEQREMSGANMHAGHWAVMVVGFGIPVLAGALYLGLGTPTVIGSGVEIETASAVSEQRHPESMDKMVANLAARLEANPDDAQGWSTLASSYMAMKRFADAATAMENLRKLVGDDPNVLVRYADALAMASGGRLTGEPAQLINQALTVDPNNTQGLWMAGMAARQQNDLHTALMHWRKLEPALANQPKLLAELQQQIANLLQRMGDQSPTEPASSESSATASQTQPAPRADSSTPAATPSTVAESTPAAATVTVRVSVHESLTQKVAPTDAVFIFARALNGPPMPLAVVRRRAADLPVTVTLDDSSAIMPTMTLSKFGEVMVGARISKSGTANPQSGDLKGEIAPIKTGDDELVSVTISQVIP